MGVGGVGRCRQAARAVLGYEGDGCHKQAFLGLHYTHKWCGARIAAVTLATPVTTVDPYMRRIVILRRTGSF